MAILKAYAAWHKDAAVLGNCASGGVASALAEATIKTNGIVVGAAYDEELRVKHIVVERPEELPRIRGVKYVHSIIDKSIYEQIVAALRANRRVFFFGLPCQCAAVRKYVNCHYQPSTPTSNLLIADLICFGAPPQSLWMKYVAWLQAKRGKRLININPRDKKYAHDRVTYYCYDWEDGKVERKLSLYDPYAQAFYRAIAFRRCCYNCQFRGENRAADLTLSDFHGAAKVGISRERIAKGVSAILCHAEKGLHALEALNLNLFEVKPSDISDNNFPYANSAALPSLWNAFAADIKTMDFAGLVKKYGLQITKMKRGVDKWKCAVVCLLRKMGVR